MNDINIIEGEEFEDYRGKILSLNNFKFDEIERIYIINNTDCDVVRGWHGHQFEKKWFYCINGSFTMAFVKIDNWENPSKDLKPVIIEISDKKSQILEIPEGYANCLRANQENSILIVLSNKRYPECLSDSWRYESNYWFDWNEMKD